MRARSLVSLVSVAMLIAMAGMSAHAGTAVSDLRKEVEDLRKRLNEKAGTAAPVGKLDSAVAKAYGPNTPVSTKNGKLQIGGLLQIWNYNITDDRQDTFGDRGDFAGTGGTSEAIDNNGYRIRRAELRFQLDIHENITARMMIDPAAEATSFPSLPSNQGLFKSQRENPSLAHDTAIATTSVGRVQSGQGAAPRLLQDAYINFHGVVPHHDFTVGQFKPKIGEEGVRDSAYLDFAERAMVTQVNDFRDMGMEMHGSWIDGRLQYWAGVFNGTGNYFGTAGNQSVAALGTFGPGNRSDDNSEKDFMGSIQGRPLWNCGDWGSLELGYSIQGGRHGEAGDHSEDFTASVNGLNRRQTAALKHAAWLSYKPMGPVRGMWLRGEWGSQHDRTAPLSVDAYDLGAGPNGEQAAPRAFTRQGWYGATGYKLADSIFADRLSRGGFFNNLMQPVEFAFRYESFQNIVTEDPAAPDFHTNLYKTNVFTTGVNYYVKAYNMRVQVNYMIVDEDQFSTADRLVREVRNNVFIFTYQVSF